MICDDELDHYGIACRLLGVLFFCLYYTCNPLPNQRLRFEVFNLFLLASTILMFYTWRLSLELVNSLVPKDTKDQILSKS